MSGERDVRLGPDAEHGQQAVVRLAGLRQLDAVHRHRERKHSGPPVGHDGDGAAIRPRCRAVRNGHLDGERLVRLLGRALASVPRKESVGNQLRAEVDEVPEAQARLQRRELARVDRDGDPLRSGDDGEPLAVTADRLVQRQRVAAAAGQLAGSGNRPRGRIGDDGRGAADLTRGSAGSRQCGDGSGEKRQVPCHERKGRSARPPRGSTDRGYRLDTATARAVRAIIASMSAIVEIRTYQLKPGSGAAFHRAVVEESLPMLERWGVAVVAFGPSLDDEDLYYLIRAYPSLEELQRSQEAFYGSDEWREGPREAIVSRIDSDISVVLPAGVLGQRGCGTIRM